jgi:hypothetical protein
MIFLNGPNNEAVVFRKAKRNADFTGIPAEFISDTLDELSFSNESLVKDEGATVAAENQS